MTPWKITALALCLSFYKLLSKVFATDSANSKAPAKRSQHASVTYRNIVGRNKLCAFDYHVAPCWVFMAQVWKCSNLSQQHSVGLKRYLHADLLASYISLPVHLVCLVVQGFRDCHLVPRRQMDGYGLMLAAFVCSFTFLLLQQIKNGKCWRLSIKHRIGMD